MQIKKLMIETSLTLAAHMTVRQAREVIHANNQNLAAVIDASGQHNGIAILRALVGKPDDAKISDFSIPVSLVLAPQDNAEKILDSQSGYVLVVENNLLKGIITPASLAVVLISIEQEKQSISCILEKLQATLDCLYNPVLSINNRGLVQFYNAAAERLLGFKKSEIMNDYLNKFYSGTKLIEVTNSGQTQSSQKIFLNNKTFLSNRTPVIKNGEIVGAAAVLQDITDLESISKELNYTKMLINQLDVIFESSFDAIWVTDGKGKILRVSPSIENLIGMPPNSIEGKYASELIMQGIHSDSIIMRSIECRKVVTGTTVTRIGKDALVTSTPIFDDAGQISLVVSNIRDISELKQLQNRILQVEGLNQFYRGELQQIKMRNKIIYRSSIMHELMNLVMRLAKFDCTVLIQGETGVGKEVIADLIHQNSYRKNKPLIKINCGAIPENLLESELFGYEAGAFTGANRQGKAGLFEVANEGTLLLDEIGELPLNLQVKLLRAVQNKTITRIGGTKEIPLDIRILSATNRDLNDMISHKQFRMDLFFRLNVASVEIPPLRERKEDILALITFFLDMCNDKYGTIKRLNSSAIDALMDYHWPGNIRELENIIERLVVTVEHDAINAHHLPKWITLAKTNDTESENICSLSKAIEDTERRLLKQAFSQYKTTRQMAKALDIHQSTLIRKAAKYGIGKNNRNC